MLNYHILETGYFLADGGVMFGPVPKRYWSAKYPCDEKNMCVLSMRCLFIETENRKILVDSGAGDKHFPKLKYYGLHKMKDIREEIRHIGYAPHEVTDVIFTHLHFDHCGGGTVFDEAYETVPAFPNATYWVSRKQWDNYRNPSPFEAGAFFADNIEPVYESGQIHFVEEDTELFPSFDLKLYDGHTPGQIAVFFETETEKLAFPGDVVPTSLNRSLSWLSAFDNHAALAYDEKKRFLDLARKDSRTLIFFHDAFTPTGKA
ncbi:MAG TPA: MBL fold metallo-hydrolase [Porphyromonadaceae bacterium]|nr:MBL fold metallo-hydrolase [Porphyromonadaceae bacterium]